MQEIIAKCRPTGKKKRLAFVLKPAFFDLSPADTDFQKITYISIFLETIAITVLSILGE